MTQSFQVAPHEEHDIKLPSGDIFHVIIFGGTDEEYRKRGETPPPVLFCVHGAGMSSSSFFVLATHLIDSPHPISHDSLQQGLTLESTHQDDNLSIIRLVTYDMRCHGDSTFNGGEANLTLQVLVEDFRNIFTTVKSTFFPHTPHFYIAGHSLGGAVVAHGLKGEKEIMSAVAGVVLLDVVEGTARVSLQHMDKFLQSRPAQFKTLEAATRWFLERGGMNSPAAAAITVPPLLRCEEEIIINTEKENKEKVYRWKSDLQAMSSVWGGWFINLDEAFITLPCPKMLCLANTERLDVALTVAQMQGKFQFEVIGNGCGHYVMDDQPTIVTSKIRRFIRRIEVMSEKLRAGTLKPPPASSFSTSAIPLTKT